MDGDGNTVTGSYFGTKHEGEFGAGNVGDGILVGGDHNTIGGGLPADRNVISDNGENGIHVQFGTGNLILGNYLGTDADGLTKLGNADAGILDEGTSTVIVSNVLSGNKTNGLVLAGTGGASVTSNLVGVVTDAGTTLPLGNGGDGIVVGGGNFVGDDGAGNTVGANGGNGIWVAGGSNIVAANFVGLDADGTQGLGNDEDGIYVTGTANEIGGADRTLGNVASDNAQDGIHVLIKGHGSAGDSVDNNLVGTHPDGVQPRPNTRDGIHIEASDNLVRENLVQFNVRNGIEVDGTGNEITANTVWYNVLRGVEIFAGTDNPIVGNSIDQNGELGIDLTRLGVTANDPGDGDGGANDRMNFPVVASAGESGGNTFVTVGIRRGLANTQFQLEFFASDACDGSNQGEAATPLGTWTVMTDGAGNFGPANTPPLGPASPGQVVTSTATLVGPGSSLLGTSELSNCFTIP